MENSFSYQPAAGRYERIPNRRGGDPRRQQEAIAC